MHPPNPAPSRPEVQARTRLTFGFNMRRGFRLTLLAGAALVLAWVFLAYLNPHLAADLARQLWACF